MGATEPRPSVVVSGLDIVYTVFGAKQKSADTGGDLPFVERLLSRRSSVGSAGAVGSVRKVHAVKNVSRATRNSKGS